VDEPGITKQEAIERIVDAKTEHRRSLARLPFGEKFKMVAEMNQLRKQVPRDQLDAALDVAVPPGQDREFAWPYNGMVHDLETAIRGKAQFLAALGLLSYSEALGRMIGKVKNADKMGDSDCFARFTQEYMKLAYPDQVKPHWLYNILRNGLVHQYEFKADEWLISLFCPHVDGCSGIHFAAPRKGGAGHVSISVVPLFKSFVNGLRTWVAEEKTLLAPAAPSAT
jgi:hypothetical protein